MAKAVIKTKAAPKTNAAATPAPKRTVNRVKRNAKEKILNLLVTVLKRFAALEKRAGVLTGEAREDLRNAGDYLDKVKAEIDGLPADWMPPSKITSKTELVDGTIVRIKAKHTAKYPAELYDADLSGELTYRSQIGKSAQCRIPPVGEGSGRIIVIPRSHLEFVRAPTDPIDVNHDGNGTAVE